MSFANFANFHNFDNFTFTAVCPVCGRGFNAPPLSMCTMKHMHNY